MENTNTPSRIHPLMAGAAIAVMLVSLTGVAAITGLIPTSHSGTAPASAVAKAEQPQAGSVGTLGAGSAPTALMDDKRKEEPPARSSLATEAASSAPRHARTSTRHASGTRVNQSDTSVASASSGAAICTQCGRIESVQTIQQAAQPSGLGIAAGAVLGGVLGNQIGGGKGRTLATVAGAVGGGYAGNEVEKRARSTTTYQVRVRTEDGRTHTFSYQHQPVWNVGDRVRISNGELVARA